MNYTVNLISKNVNSAVTTTNITSKVENGFSLHEKLDESLDIGSMTIPSVTRSTPYTMFDIIQVKLDGEEVFAQLIGGDTVQLVSKNPKMYKHNLSLVELTKMLELFIISGKTFTQPTDGTTTYTLAEVITILNDTTQLELEELVDSTRLFKWDSSCDYYSLLNGISSPEFTFKDMTLREALNEVCSYIGAIPRLVLNDGGILRLTFDFVNELKELIESESDFVEKRTQQDIQFYSTQLESDAYNLVNDSDVNESVEIYPDDGSYTTARSDEYIFDYLKSYIPTPKNVYNATVNMKVSSLSVSNSSAEVYNSDIKYDYYATYGDFPNIEDAKEDIFYVDISNSNQCYVAGTTAYVTTSVTTSEYPKIRYVENYASFDSTDTTGRGLDIFIDRTTKKVYVWDTIYVETDKIDYDGYLIMDLSDRIFEYNTYSQQDIDSTINATEKYDPSNYFQSNTLYYNYRQKNIPLGNTVGIWDTQTSIYIIARVKAFEILQSVGLISSTDTYDDYTYLFANDTPENDFMYQVKYTSIPSSVRISIDRQDLSDVNINSTLQSNQISRIVNLENYTNNKQAKINRVGNSELQLDCISSNIESLNVIGDYTEDIYIVTERELIFNVDYIYSKLLLSKNYNMISKFISVDSEIRQWEVGEQNTLERKLMYSEYVEIDFVESGVGTNNCYLVQDDGAKAFVETFKPSSTYEPIRGGIFDSSKVDYDLVCPISSNGGGNSLIFDWQFDSNKYVGSYRDTTNGEQVAGNFASYTNNTGEMRTFDLYLFNKSIQNLITPSEILAYANNLPITDKAIIDTTYVKNNSGYSFYVEKDNREKLGGTFQIKAYTDDANNKILGRWLFRRNRLVNEKPPTEIKLYVSDTVELSRTSNFILPSSGYTQLTSPTITVDSSSYRVLLSHAGLTSSIVSYVLTDENDFVLCGCNQNGKLLDTITFDFKNKKTGIIYQGIYVVDANVSSEASTSLNITYTQALNKSQYISSEIITSLNATYTQILNATQSISSEVSTNLDITYTQALNESQSVSSEVTTSVSISYNKVEDLVQYISSSASTGLSVSYSRVLPTTYTVNFYDYDGDLLSTQEVISGEDATAPSNPSRTGYDFDGWSGTYTNVTSDRTITATYVIQTFDVRFFIGIDQYDRQTVNYGADATTPTTPTQEQDDTYYYTFDGWDTSYTNVTSDLIVGGSFTQHVRTDVEWVEIASGVQTGTECLDAFDVGDILKVTADSTCVYEGALTYNSSTDESTLPPPCSDGETYRQCLWNGSVWRCTNYTGVIYGGEITFYECKFQE